MTEEEFYVLSRSVAEMQADFRIATNKRIFYSRDRKNADIRWFDINAEYIRKTLVQMIER